MRLLIKRKCSSSAPILPENRELPLDLWREVFARLPVKTLLKLRCVCKNWCSIINNPDFFSMHLSIYNNNTRNNKAHALVMQNIGKNGCEGCKFTLRPTNKFKKIAQILRIPKFCKILGNCNGLVLFMSKEYPSSEQVMLRLWNPSVRKSLIIPFIPSDFKWETYVLGFSPSSNDYKVVAFDFDRDGNVYAVYSISTNTWRIKPCPSNSLPLFVLEAGGKIPLYDSPHFCEGAVHWMVCGSVPNIYTHVLSFEFDTEDFHIVELPDSAGEVEMCRGLTTVCELLAVFGISALNCCIWVMKKEGGEKLWSLRFSGDSCLDSYNFVARDCYFLKRFYYEQKTGVISLVTSRQGMKSYNISTQRRHHLFNSVSRSIAYMDAYVESLVWFP